MFHFPMMIRIIIMSSPVQLTANANANANANASCDTKVLRANTATEC